MVRTFSYLFTAPTNLDQAPDKVRKVALNRCRMASNGLYGVVTEVDGTDLKVTIRVDGHGYFGAMTRARHEVEALAKTLRMGPGTVTLLTDQSEPSMRNLTVEQGRAQSYTKRTETRLRKRADRLERFRKENAEWLASSSPS